MGDVEGASPKEQILEACRRDNTELFAEVLESISGQGSKEKTAQFFNDTTDTLGNHLLHVCANYGSYDVMNELLDIEYLECDPLTRRDGETPIHSAVKYANERDIELGQAMAQMLIDAGGDPRVKDKHGRKPADICTPRTEELRALLRQEEYIATEGLKDQQQNQNQNQHNGGGHGDDNHDDDDGGPTGSASDSD